MVLAAEPGCVVFIALFPISDFSHLASASSQVQSKDPLSGIFAVVLAIIVTVCALCLIGNAWEKSCGS